MSLIGRNDGVDEDLWGEVRGLCGLGLSRKQGAFIDATVSVENGSIVFEMFRVGIKSGDDMMRTD